MLFVCVFRKRRLFVMQRHECVARWQDILHIPARLFRDGYAAINIELLLATCFIHFVFVRFIVDDLLAPLQSDAHKLSLL